MTIIRRSNNLLYDTTYVPSSISLTVTTALAPAITAVTIVKTDDTTDKKSYNQYGIFFSFSLICNYLV